MPRVITGTGSYLPEQIVTNDELLEYVQNFDERMAKFAVRMDRTSLHYDPPKLWYEREEVLGCNCGGHYFHTSTAKMLALSRWIRSMYSPPGRSVSPRPFHWTTWRKSSPVKAWASSLV